MVPPVVTALVVLLTAVAPAMAPAQQSAPDRPLAQASPADLTQGQRAYNAQCALCHGIDGGGGYGPSLRQSTLSRVANDAGLVQLIKDGIPGAMPGDDFGANAESRIWQVAAYVRSLGRGAATERAAGNAERGLAVYQQRGCANCHVRAGEGRAIGPELTSIGVQRGVAYLRQAVVEPGARVPDGHVVVTARPKNGPAVRGIRLNEDVFWVHLRDVSGKTVSYRKADLDDLVREAGASLMPAYTTLPAPDLDDLVAYLASLRGAR